MFLDSYYLMLVVPALLISLFAQIKVKSTFSKYSKVFSKKGITAYDATRKILDDAGLFGVKIERIAGELTDHFDPRANVIRLSDSVYNSTSVASIGVAAHEAGHAIQHEHILNILDNSASFYESEKTIGAILMEKGIQIKEVEEFLSKVRPIVQNRVDKLISKDSEWQTLGDKDKEYKLEEYMSESMVEFDEEVSPAMSGSLTHLTFNNPTQVPLLQEVIMQYGAHNISTYCEHSGRKNPIIKIPNTNYRKPLEQLVEAGLAYTGKDMSVEELLSSLTLAELNEIATADKKFTRKDKAIQFLAAKEDITSIIERHIALRSLFILIPLPEEFKEFDIEKYKVSLNYYNKLACVLTSLYNGYSTMKYIK